jgi:tripartite-type tricarboxylate transporter receptor subunit TctC
MRTNILLLVATSLLSLLSLPAGAQNTTWPAPNKPITFINPFPPGGAVDAFGRPLAKQLSTQLNDSIVVDNRGGANGFIACELVAKAPADGYTVLLTTGTTHWANPSLFKKLPKWPKPIRRNTPLPAPTHRVALEERCFR